MASYIETKAVALRKGDTPSNLLFTGILGEVVADLGYEQNGILGLDVNATLRLHNGITKGGIPLCRADTRNITTQVLAENRGLFDDKNLAYADLTNLEETEDPEAINTIVTTFSKYGITTNEDLMREVSKLALKDMSNVITSTLATGRGRGENGNLAYADTNNINTKDLTDITIHDGVDEGDLPLSYANLSNVDTTNVTLDLETRPETVTGPILARQDLTNITPEIWQGTLFNPDNNLNLEVTTNKDESIPMDLEEIQGEHYPTTSAVAEYIDNVLIERQYLVNDFSNASDYYTLYSNKDGNYKYVTANPAIVNPGTKFTSKTYWTGKILENQKSSLHVEITDVSGSGDITAVKILPSIGLENLNEKSIIIEDENVATNEIKSAEIQITATYNDKYKVYEYTGTVNTSNITTGTENLYYPKEEILLQTLLCVEIIADSDTGAITSYKFTPQYGEVFFENETITLESENEEEGVAAELTLVTNNISKSVGGAKLLKTDLSNLRGMSEKDSFIEQDSPWRISHAENITSVTSETIKDSEYYNIANNGKVWEALRNTKKEIEKTSSVTDWKANVQYTATPYKSKVLYNGDIYYCISDHTSGETFDTSKWKKVSIDTYEQLANKNSDISLDTTSINKYPNNSAVVKYVKEQIEAMHTPGHYQGQVDIFVQNENELPGNSSPSTEYTIEPSEGLSALIVNYSVTKKPAKALYTDGAWTYENLILQNGVYVYVLNLGKSYDNGPGNATWNEETQDFDIAADKFQVPDGISLNLNELTGAIQIVPELQTKLSYVDVTSSIQTTLDDIYDHLNTLDQSLAAMVIPNPQFFTGTGTSGQQLVLTDDVAFDLYVNGQFQYPNTYTYDKETKTITLDWAVQNTTPNGIAVIYRGFRTLK